MYKEKGNRADPGDPLIIRSKYGSAHYELPFVAARSKPLVSLSISNWVEGETRLVVADKESVLANS